MHPMTPKSHMIVKSSPMRNSNDLVTVWGSCKILFYLKNLLFSKVLSVPYYQVSTNAPITPKSRANTEKAT